MIAGVLAGIATANQAMEDSNVDAVLRPVGFEQISWSSPSNTCEAQGEIQDLDGIADDVHDLRNEYGADLVVAVVQPGSGASGCTNTVIDPDHNTTYDKFVFAIRTNSSTAIRHEPGHLAGLCHARENTGCSQWGNVEDYAYGYLWPDANVITDPEDICDGEEFSTIMASPSADSVTIGTKTWTYFPRINRYSRPTGIVIRECADETTVPRWHGTSVDDANGLTAESQRRLDETLPELAQYRDAVALAGGAEISSPASGASVSGSATFDWNDQSPDDRYWLEVYDPASETFYEDTAVNGTSSYAASGLPTDGRVLAARLWTDLATDPDSNYWTWVDHRFNNKLEFVDCSAEDEGIVPSSFFGSNSCTDSEGDVCSWSSGSGTVDCDLRRTGGGTTGEIYAVSTSTRQVCRTTS